MTLFPKMFLLLALLLLGACGGSNSDDSDTLAQQTTEGTSIVFDAEMTPEERNSLTTSTEAMKSFAIDGSTIRWFPEIFGGTDSSAVFNYMDTRVNYALSESTDIASRFVTRTSAMSMYNMQIFASNPSFYLWYSSKAAEPQDLKFLVNNTPVDIDSTRIGVMQFGDIFTTSDTALQAITLVHEARHSDCTGGALASDVNRFRSGSIPQNSSCAHLHTFCPPGHPLEGIVACDAHPWGAYVIDAIYSLAISENCTSCTEAQKQAAEINFFEVVNRPLFLEDLLNGEFGPPDMSSSNEVRQDI